MSPKYYHPAQQPKQGDPLKHAGARFARLPSDPTEDETERMLRPQSHARFHAKLDQFSEKFAERQRAKAARESAAEGKRKRKAEARARGLPS